MVQGVGSSGKAVVAMKANEIGQWLRQEHAGKCDHREVLSGDDLVLRPGPNFDWLMGNLGADQPTPSARNPEPAGDDCREAGD